MSVAVKRVAALQKPTASIIFLHGLGDTSDGWSVLASELHKRPDLQHINVVLPTAPTQLVSGFGDYSTSWFDLKTMGPSIGRGCDGYFDTIKIVKQLIKNEIDKGIPAHRIVLGGFSQGAAVALGAAVVLDEKLGGFIGHSGFLVDEVKAFDKTPVNIDSPVLMIHGMADPVVLYAQCGEPACKYLEKRGFKNITWRAYQGLPHTASLETVEDIMSFLKKNMA